MRRSRSYVSKRVERKAPWEPRRVEGDGHSMATYGFTRPRSFTEDNAFHQFIVTRLWSRRGSRPRPWFSRTSWQRCGSRGRRGRMHRRRRCGGSHCGRRCSGGCRSSRRCCRSSSCSCSCGCWRERCRCSSRGCSCWRGCGRGCGRVSSCRRWGRCVSSCRCSRSGGCGCGCRRWRECRCWTRSGRWRRRWAGCRDIEIALSASRRTTGAVAEVLSKERVVSLHSSCGRCIAVSHCAIDHVKAWLPLGTTSARTRHCHSLGSTVPATRC